MQQLDWLESDRKRLDILGEIERKTNAICRAVDQVMLGLTRSYLPFIPAELQNPPIGERVLVHTRYPDLVVTTMIFKDSGDHYIWFHQDTPFDAEDILEWCLMPESLKSK